jgi:hypothetical protein
MSRARQSGLNFQRARQSTALSRIANPVLLAARAKLRRIDLTRIRGTIVITLRGIKKTS